MADLASENFVVGSKKNMGATAGSGATMNDYTNPSSPGGTATSAAPSFVEQNLFLHGRLKPNQITNPAYWSHIPGGQAPDPGTEIKGRNMTANTLQLSSALPVGFAPFGANPHSPRRSRRLQPPPSASSPSYSKATPMPNSTTTTPYATNTPYYPPSTA